MSRATLIGPATHTCSVRITPLEDDESGLSVIEVYRGNQLLISTMGDDLYEGLLKFLSYLLPT